MPGTCRSNEEQMCTLRAENQQLRRFMDKHHHSDLMKHAADLTVENEQLRDEVDLLRGLLVKAEGYTIASGADRPFVARFVEGTPHAEAIERAGGLLPEECSTRTHRQVHPEPTTARTRKDED